MLIVGIDPGLHGAIAQLETRTRKASAWPMPVYRDPPVKHRDGTVDRGREHYDVERILEMVEATHGPVWLEKLGPLPNFRKDGSKLGSGGIANYNRGAATWLFVGMLAALKRECHQVVPQAWQNAMLEGIAGETTKAQSIWLAQRLFPEVSLFGSARSRSFHDGMADALCIAEYGRRQRAGDKGRQMGLLAMGAP